MDSCRFYRGNSIKEDIFCLSFSVSYYGLLHVEDIECYEDESPHKQKLLSPRGNAAPETPHR